MRLQHSGEKVGWNKVKVAGIYKTSFIQDDIQHAASDELNDLRKVCKYQDAPWAGANATAGVRAEPFSGKAI